MELSVRLAKSLMKLAEETPPPPDVEVGRLGEVFQHSLYVNGTPQAQAEIRRRSAEFFYRDELDYPWDHYFGLKLKPSLCGKNALDLGCFTGGRSVAWCEMYELAHLTGVDVAPHCIQAATEFATSKKVHAQFDIAHAESLPFESDGFDAVLSFETFEHVADVSKSLAECNRVLKPGGRLYCVFPGYFHPIGHHLGLATNMPFLQLLFSGPTLVKAYFDILQARGASAEWYRRPTRLTGPWERGNTINGTTFMGFSKLVKAGPWKIILVGRAPFGSIGRRASKLRGVRPLCKCLYPLTFVPGLQEVFLHHIVFILEKDK
jgi:SAM-dependent methyltransferase